MSKFDELFDNSKLPEILKMAKTLSKEECRQIYLYMEEYKPKVVLEFGVQFGCSTAVFLQISKWLDLDIELHSWDIVDVVKSSCVNKKDFSFHVEDITGKEEETLLKYQPDMIFLDAHPYHMTKALMKACVKHKINFLTHDVNKRLYDGLEARSGNFKRLETYGAWELYVLAELFSPVLIEEDYFENDEVEIRCYRDIWGLCVVKVK